MTHELFNFITELRPLHTSMGLAENIKREHFSTDTMRPAHRASELHLLEYKQRMLGYIQNASNRRASPWSTKPLTPFSPPYDPSGYADVCISDDLITDVYLEFSERTRKLESEQYLWTLTGSAQMTSHANVLMKRFPREVTVFGQYIPSSWESNHCGQAEVAHEGDERGST
jgi:hypothetical protein